MLQPIGCNKKEKTMSLFKSSLLAVAIVATPALAAETSPAKVDPYAKPSNSFITINGTVKSAGPDSFLLDYGKGLITVEMDDWDWYPEGYKVLGGDNVTVYGRIDDDLFEITTIEASSVYVKGLNSFFFANDTDEEDVAYVNFIPTTTAAIQGEVTSIDGREFTVSTGNGVVTVDTATMPYNPLDKEGYQQVKVGHRVSVVGGLNPGFFSEREIEADAVMTLSKNRTSLGS